MAGLPGRDLYRSMQSGYERIIKEFSGDTPVSNEMFAIFVPEFFNDKEQLKNRYKK